MARQPQSYRPNALLGSLAFCFGLWIIVGAIAYSSWPSPPGAALSFGEVFLLTIIPSIYITTFLILNTQYSFHPSPPVSSLAVFIGVVLCCCATTAFCIVTSGSRNLFEDYFLVIGSGFVGAVFEISTGLLTGYLRRREHTDDVPLEDHGLERVDKTSH